MFELSGRGNLHTIPLPQSSYRECLYRSRANQWLCGGPCFRADDKFCFLIVPEAREQPEDRPT